MKWYLYILVSLLLLETVFAECNEENIRLFLNQQKESIVNDMTRNMDESFVNYEKFNTQQMSNFVTNSKDLFTRISVFLLIGLLGLISFVMSIWNLIFIKRQKRILFTIIDENRQIRDLLNAFLNSDNITTKKYEMPKLKPAQETIQQPIQQTVQNELRPTPVKKGFFSRFKKDKTPTMPFNIEGQPKKEEPKSKGSVSFNYEYN